MQAYLHSDEALKPCMMHPAVKQACKIHSWAYVQMIMGVWDATVRGMDLWSISMSLDLQVLGIAVRMVAICNTPSWVHMQMIEEVGDATVRGMGVWSISMSSDPVLSITVRTKEACKIHSWAYVQMIMGVGNATVRGMDLWSISMSSGLPEQYSHNSLQSAHQSKANGQANGHHNGQADGHHDGQVDGQVEGSKRRQDIPLRQQAPFIDDELPSAVHIQQDSSIQGSKRAGKFTYYFTVGLDAEAAYRCAKLPLQTC